MAEVARPASVASAGVTNPTLAALVEAHWEATMARSPEWATTLGDHRFDDRLDDAGEATEHAWQAQLRRFELQVVWTPEEGLSRTDRTHRALLAEEIRAELGLSVCRFAEWNLSTSSNELAALHGLAEQLEPADEAALRTAMTRFRAFPARVDVRIGRLRHGLETGRVSNAVTIDRIVSQLDAALATPPSEWEPAKALIALGDRLVAEDRRAAFASEVGLVFEGEVRAAIERYRAFLLEELAPAATVDDGVGLGSLPDGSACYAASIRRYTSLDLDPDQVHHQGLDELASIHLEFEALGAQVFGTSDRAEIFRRLREDPALRFQSREEVRSAAEGALGRAQEAAPRAFASVPAAPCEVAEVPDWLAPYTWVAWYEQVRPDGSRPGTYYVNTWAPETRLRHESEVLAFHEAVPGHHLQIARARELGELPAFRRFGDQSAFVEGWAVYGERLADELGLYSSSEARLGMLAFDAWRAARLVVDTGLHSRGWSRDRAIAFLMDNTPLSRDNIENEVDRYITWPGQALSYKVGQLRIRALRAEAESRLGARFDLRRFHEAVLGQGAVTLPILDESVERWIESEEASAL